MVQCVKGITLDLMLPVRIEEEMQGIILCNIQITLGRGELLVICLHLCLQCIPQLLTSVCQALLLLIEKLLLRLQLLHVSKEICLAQRLLLLQNLLLRLLDRLQLILDLLNSALQLLGCLCRCLIKFLGICVIFLHGLDIQLGKLRCRIQLAHPVHKLRPLLLKSLCVRIRVSLDNPLHMPRQLIGELLGFI